VPIDRAATLRNAEKLLRQGKVDAAIAEYVRVVEDNPRDWNTANVLGDLYVRASRSDKAIEQFLRIADSLREQGFLPKAAALYKKILKIKPDQEDALLRAGEIAAELGFNADARTHLRAVLDRRTARGDARGAAEVRVRLGVLDAGDFEARIAAATARIELDDAAGAARDLDQLATELADKDRLAEAIDVLRRASALPAGTAAIEERIVELSLTLAERHLQAGRIDEGLAAAKALLGDGASVRNRIAALAGALGASAPDAAFRTIELLVDAAVAGDDWSAAAALLQEFVARAQNHVPALMRLVEVCVDGALEGVLDSAQGQLADAHLANGNAAEARFIAEDLFTRHPSDPVNVERFRRSLQLLGEADPDAIIAERLEALSPLANGDLNAEDFGSVPTVPDPPPVAAEHNAVDAEPPPSDDHLPGNTLEIAEPAAPAELSARAGREAPPRRAAMKDSVDVFELSANAIDIASILGEFEEPARPKPAAPPESVEVDLSVVLDDIKRPPPIAPLMPRNGAASGVAPPASPSAPVPGQRSPEIQGDDIENVFAHLRDEASRRSAIEAAEQEFRRGLALKAAGDIDGCIAALETASRAPKLRFATASLLARIFRDRGRLADAVLWYERALQAPAPTPDDYHVLLFELAEALEAEGETIRALAVCLELRADAGEYRDVADRVDRLAKVQARG